MDNRMRETPTPEPTIDQEARSVIYGDREQTYGHPSKNLQLIADFWTSYIKGKEVLTCDDVCNMMILMKTARLKNMPEHRDSLVDTIGYTLLKERCREVDSNLQRQEEQRKLAAQHVIDLENAMMGLPVGKTIDIVNNIQELNE